MRRKRELDAPHSTHRIILTDKGDQLLGTGDGQLLAREASLLQSLEELVDIDLLEQEPSRVQNILAFTNHVILHGKELVGQRSTVGITIGENLELALTIHGQELLKLGHLSSSFGGPSNEWDSSGYRVR